MIRQATRADVPAIVDMAMRFYAVSGYERIAPIAKESAAGIVLVCIDAGVMLVAEREDGSIAGMVCLHIEPYLFNIDTTIAQEIAWWIEPDARGGMLAARLLKAAEAAAREAGASVLRMGVLHDSPPQAAALYERMGYSPSDRAYLKVIKP